MVTIRLSRGGAKGRPFYHLAVSDSRRARDGRDESVRHGAHGLGGQCREVGHRRAGLVEVDFLQCQHVGVQLPDGLLEPCQRDPPGVQAAPVQDVEGGQSHAHGY